MLNGFEWCGNESGVFSTMNVLYLSVSFWQTWFKCDREMAWFEFCKKLFSSFLVKCVFLGGGGKGGGGQGR